jgi:CHAT domain-containing protein
MLTKLPPSGVEGLLVQIRQAKQDTDRLDKNKQILSQAIPDDVSKNQRIELLEQRVRAAEELGDVTQQLADLNEILTLSRGTRNEIKALYNAGSAQAMYGDVVMGIDALKEAITQLARVNNMAGIEIAALGYLANAALLRGDVALSLQHTQNARGLLNRLKATPGGWWAFIPSWEMGVYFSEAKLLIANGKWAEGEANLRLAVARSEETARNLDRLSGMANNANMQSNVLAGRNVMVADLAQHLMRQGKFDEAELLLRDMLAVNLQRVGRLSIRTSLILNQLADLMGARGRVADGLVLLQEVEEINRAMGLVALNKVTMNVAVSKLNLLIGSQSWAGAVAMDDAFNRQHNASRVKQLSLMNAGLGLALVRSGRADQALQRLQPLVAQHASAMGEAHPQVAEERGILAMAHQALGARAQALQLFAQAGTTLLSLQPSDSEGQDRSMQALIRRLVLESYLDLLADQPDATGAADMAFRIADALHLGKTQQALSQSAVRAAAQQADLAALIRDDQDRKAEQLSLYSQLLRLAGLPPEQQLPQVMNDMRARIASIDKERQNFGAALQKRFPAYANLVQPKAPSLDETRAALKDKEALINVFSTDRATYVWAVSRNAPTAFVRVALSREDIAKRVASLRRALDPGEANLAKGIPAFDVNLAHRLYADLLQPVAAAWKGADSLLVVSNGALGQLPLGLLPTAPATVSGPLSNYAAYKSVPWLIKDAAITQLPSANALVTLRSLPAGNANRKAFVGFGDPDFTVQTTQVASAATNTTNAHGLRRVTATRSSNQAWMPYSDLSPLPDTRDEILALAEVLKADPKRDVFLGRDASKAKVLTTPLNQSKVVAFATHGLLPGEFPGVDQPSLAMSNPGQGQHGLLTLDDILGLKLDADWVVLSACNTAAGDGNGAEAVSGLGRGFFYAGTRALLATHWPVESASARLLVTATFEQQAQDPGMSRAQALRASMLQLMNQQAPDGFSYAHPLFWAPYALFGDGGQ